MTFIRRILGRTILAVVAAAALAAPAAAQQGPDGARGHRWARFSPILTQEQMQQIGPWVQGEREAAKPLAAQQKELREALLSEAPDQGKIAALQAQIAPLQAEAFGRRVALAQRIAALLTAEQRQQLRQARFVPPFLDPGGPAGPAFGMWHGRRGPRGQAPDAPRPQEP